MGDPDMGLQTSLKIVTGLDVSSILTEAHFRLFAVGNVGGEVTVWPLWYGIAYVVDK